MTANAEGNVYGIITGTNVNIREKPSVDGKVVHTLQLSNHVVRCLEKSDSPSIVNGSSNYWYRVDVIEHDSTFTGWVFGKYIKEVPESTNEMDNTLYEIIDDMFGPVQIINPRIVKSIYFGKSFYSFNYSSETRGKRSALMEMCALYTYESKYIRLVVNCFDWGKNSFIKIYDFNKNSKLYCLFANSKTDRQDCKSKHGLWFIGLVRFGHGNGDDEVFFVYDISESVKESKNISMDFSYIDLIETKDKSSCEIHVYLKDSNDKLIRHDVYKWSGETFVLAK
jgi:hypothetical protein